MTPPQHIHTHTHAFSLWRLLARVHFTSHTAAAECCCACQIKWLHNWPRHFIGSAAAFLGVNRWDGWAGGSPEDTEIKTAAPARWRDPPWHDGWAALKHKFNFSSVNYKDCGVIAFVGRSRSLSLGLLLALMESTSCPHLRKKKHVC